LRPAFLWACLCSPCLLPPSAGLERRTLPAAQDRRSGGRSRSPSRLPRQLRGAEALKDQDEEHLPGGLAVAVGAGHRLSCRRCRVSPMNPSTARKPASRILAVWPKVSGAYPISSICRLTRTTKRDANTFTHPSNPPLRRCGKSVFLRTT